MRQNPQCNTYKCLSSKCQNVLTEFETFCKICGCNLSVCVASGRSIFTKEYYECKACRHKSLFKAIQELDLKHCALCHAPIDKASMNAKIRKLEKMGKYTRK